MEPRPSQKLSLSSNWQWKQAGAGRWTKCTLFPTVIHHELRAADLIPDEGVALNERQLQWVGEQDWLFATSFATPEDVHNFDHVDLVFDGLDTIARVALNGEGILECDNMFLPHRVDVKNKVRTDGQENMLELYFDSAARVAREREEKHGSSFSGLRQSSRLHVRKAQYHWGWDWGPSMITCGPYKDVRLERYSVRIDDFHVAVDGSSKSSCAIINMVTQLEGTIDGTFCIIKIRPDKNSPGQEMKHVFDLTSGCTSYEAAMKIEEPQWWWPRGHGAQPLYIAEVSIVDRRRDIVLDKKTSTFGLRSVELVQEPLQSDTGKSFFLRVNGHPIFCVGTNWIPSRSLPPLVTPELYRRWIDLALENNNNMIRIWGGGYYENEEFYKYCDQKGVMLWHDFMFACGFYPNRTSFHKSVTAEIKAQVKRLRNHPCITLWCGDNEFYMMADRQNEPYDPTETHDFQVYPERALYFQTIPDVVNVLTPDIPYWPSSPFGGSPANGGKEGDIHQWNVWHGLQLHYQEFPRLSGRFVSEYGMHGFPNIRTVRYFAPNQRDQYWNSRVMDCHNKSSGAESKLSKYLFANFRTNPYDLETYIYTSQLLQCEALTYGNRNWRRGWKGPGKEECSGVLIWQLNDIYPCTSWALADSFFRKKPAFYTSARDFAPICVGISRNPVWRFVDENERTGVEDEIPGFEIFASNLGMEAREVELTLRMWDLTANREVDCANRASKFVLAANVTTELLKLEPPSTINIDSLLVLAAYVHDASTKEELSRHFSWPEPYRYLPSLPSATVDVVSAPEEGAVTLVCGTCPVKGALAYIDWRDGEDAEWRDNMYDLLPGDRVRLLVDGVDGRQVQCRWLHSWEKDEARLK